MDPTALLFHNLAQPDSSFQVLDSIKHGWCTVLARREYFSVAKFNVYSLYNYTCYSVPGKHPCSKYPCTRFQWANLYPGQVLKLQVMFKHLWVLVRDTTVYTSTYSRGGGRFPSKSKRDRRKEGKEREVVEKGHMYFFALWCTISNPCTCTSVTSKNWEGGGHGAYETATPTPVSFWMNNILYSEKP